MAEEEPASIEELAQDLELEVRILRSLAHKSPADAYSFLHGILQKIQRSCSKPSTSSLSTSTPESDDANGSTEESDPDPPLDSTPPVSRTQTILNVLRNGPMERTAICAQVALIFGEDREHWGRTKSMLWQLLYVHTPNRRIKELKDGRIALTESGAASAH